MSKQSFFAEARIIQSVATLAGADDSLASINTSKLSDRAIVAVAENNSLYMLRKDSTATASSPTIIAPAEGGPGRWYLYSAGADQFQDVAVSYALIPNQSSVDSSFAWTGPTLSVNDILLYNLTDSGLPTGVVTGPIRITGGATATMRFTNATPATVAAGTASFRMAVAKSA